MRLIIAGGRNIKVTTQFIDCCIIDNHLREIREIVSGGANGVDACGEEWARSHKRNYMRFEADWDKYGKAAGPMRNKEMAEYADVLLLIWDGRSRGSASMKREMEALRKPVYEVILK